MDWFLLVKAFLVGGGLCLLAQLAIDLTRLTPARILVSYVMIGVILSAFGLYAPLARFSGCGASLPLTGFGHLLATGVKNAVDEEGALGILTGGLTAASGGITSTLVFGYAAALLARGRPKYRS